MSLRDNSLDVTGWRLLEALQRDGRASYKELGNLVGLSTPAVAERVRRLEESGTISGYRAIVDLARLGRAITAFVSVQTTPERNARLIEYIQSSPVVLEGHYVTGQASFIFKIAVASIAEMEQFINAVSHYGATQTSIVMSTHMQNKVITDQSTSE